MDAGVLAAGAGAGVGGCWQLERGPDGCWQLSRGLSAGAACMRPGACRHHALAHTKCTMLPIAQVLFLLYHYYNAKEIYNAIRLFIAAYVWMTGFGEQRALNSGMAWRALRVK